MHENVARAYKESKQSHPVILSGRYTMKRVSLIFAGLLLVGSASVFAEGGAERMKHYWDNIRAHTAQSQTD